MENSGAFGGSNSFNQLAGLERRTRTLEDSSLDLLARIQRLEKEAGIGSISISLSAPVKESLTAPDSMPIAEALPVAPVAARASAEALDETEIDGDPSAVNIAGGAVAGAESIESRIGLYWLSRLGIGFLVVGIALFIMYSFNNFGPVAKIATGYIFAAALLGLGEMMERRDNMPWYARLIEGGAWAVGFFTTYAMHHVEAVKVIASPLVDLGLLMGVTALAVSHATAKKSEMMAIFAVSLGFITLGLSHITGFTALAATMLVALSVVLTVRQGWYQLFLYSVFASYGALVYSGALGVRGQETSVLNLLLFLVPSLCGFSLVPLFLKAQDKMASQTLTIGLVLNNLAFLTLFFNHADKLLGAAVAPYALAVGG